MENILSVEIIVKLTFMLAGSYLFMKFVYLVFFYFVILPKWLLTKGKITTVDTVIIKDGAEAGWEKRVTYSYNIGDQTFESNNITKNITTYFPFKEWADASLRRYCVGQIVDVKYNPKKPTEALVDLKFDMNNIMLIIAFIICLLFVVFL